MIRVPNVALALDAERVLDLDSERRGSPSTPTIDVTLAPGAKFVPGQRTEFSSSDGTRWRLEAVSEDRATVVEVRDA